MKIHIDFETRSFCDLKKCGAWVYSEHETTDIICMAYKTDDGNVGLWLPGDDLPVAFSMMTTQYIARNALFEHAICANVAIRKYGFPERMCDPKNWICTAAMSRRVGMPGSLNDCAIALNVEQKKMTVGTSLINKYSVPVRPKTGKPYFRELKGDDEKAMYDYCMADVIADSQCYAILEKLPENNLQLEKDTFYLDFAQNVQGLPVDIENAIKIDAHLQSSFKDAKKESEKTGIKVTSSPQIISLCADYGYKIDNAQATTIEKLLDNDDLPDALREALELRGFLGKASVKKYATLIRRTSADGRLRHSIRYFGTHTGRYSGQGFQPQNMPKMETTEKEISGLVDSYQSITPGTPAYISALKKMLPGMLIPLPGYKFIMGDFSSIEARALAFMAGEKWRLDVFNSHGKIYEASAAAMFKIPIDSITKESKYRKYGKTAELALGYQGWTGALKKFGASSFMKEEEMAPMILKWREANKAIVSFWGRVEEAFIKAYRTKSRVPLGKYLVFTGTRRYVTITLPSMRSIYYHEVKIIGGKISYFNHAQRRRVDAYGGKLTENIMQAVCRDIFVLTMIEMKNAGLNPLLHTHDEVVCREPEEGLKKKCELFERISNTPPDWFKGFPLKTDYEISGRYHK